MEKYQRLFSQNYEDGVAQFRNFWQDEEWRPEAADPVIFDVAEKYVNMHLLMLIFGEFGRFIAWR